MRPGSMNRAMKPGSMNPADRYAGRQKTVASLGRNRIVLQRRPARRQPVWKSDLLNLRSQLVSKYQAPQSFSYVGTPPQRKRKLDEKWERAQQNNAYSARNWPETRQRLGIGNTAAKPKENSWAVPNTPAQKPAAEKPAAAKPSAEAPLFTREEGRAVRRAGIRQAAFGAGMTGLGGAALYASTGRKLPYLKRASSKSRKGLRSAGIGLGASGIANMGVGGMKTAAGHKYARKQDVKKGIEMNTVSVWGVDHGVEISKMEMDLYYDEFDDEFEKSFRSRARSYYANAQRLGRRGASAVRDGGIRAAGATGRAAGRAAGAIRNNPRKSMAIGGGLALAGAGAGGYAVYRRRKNNNVSKAMPPRMANAARRGRNYVGNAARRGRNYVGNAGSRVIGAPAAAGRFASRNRAGLAVGAGIGGAAGAAGGYAVGRRRRDQD